MSTVELTRETDGPACSRRSPSMASRAQLVDDDEHLTVTVEDCDEEKLAHAIEDWIAARDLPLVPMRIGDCTFAVSPPAG